jgi:hypothetical protein
VVLAVLVETLVVTASAVAVVAGVRLGVTQVALVAQLLMTTETLTL